VARLGGDEFLVLLADLLPTTDGQGGPDSTEQAHLAAQAVATRIHAAMRKPFVVDGVEFSISTSIGISVFLLDAEDSRTLLKNADAAMYRSKKAGPAGTVLFSSGTHGTSSNMALADRMRKAADEGQGDLQ
jgi:diguanylate cyclase (GGDEF)-like protein